jgi:hypothetical protein
LSSPVPDLAALAGEDGAKLEILAFHTRVSASFANVIFFQTLVFFVFFFDN